MITHYENSNPTALSIITGDFNQANLRSVLPNYHQLITCATRGSKTLDHCYCTIKGAYKSIQRGNLGNSDHSTVLLIPAYKQLLKQTKPVKKTIKLWTEDATEKLIGCFESTNWETFKHSNNLDEFTDTVIDYIKFCEDTCLPKKSVTLYPNKKVWFHPDIRSILAEKDQAYKTKDTNPARFSKARRDWKCAVRQAKKDYKVKLESHFDSTDSQQLWSCMNLITNFKGPKKQVDCTDTTLPDQLNTFYARFDCNNHTEPVPAAQGDIEPAFVIQKSDVTQCFKKLKEKKAPGPDGISPRLLKNCASQLAGVFSTIYNWSLQDRKVPTPFKKATIIPVPKKNTISCLNDYRPVALTAVPMKSFERIVMKHIKSILPSDFDPHQFAYRSNRSVEDAISLGLHRILHHLETPSSYVRVLFIDYSSAFNTIIPQKLHDKLLNNLKFPAALSDWILDFLINRQQVVKVDRFLSSSKTLSTGAPQGCVLSPLLYSIFTFDCTASDERTLILKFADDTTICGFIKDNDETAYRTQVKTTENWCCNNNLILNVAKTKEIIVDFRKNKNEKQPLIINGQNVEQVDNYKFLGTHISNDLKWQKNSTDIVKKARQRLYFLRTLSSFNIQQRILVNFYRAIIESILTRSITVWFGSATQSDITRMNNVICSAQKIIGVALPSMHSIYNERTKKRTRAMIKDEFHPANCLFQFLKSGKRFRTFYGNKRFTNSFYPSAVRIFNCS